MINLKFLNQELSIYINLVKEKNGKQKGGCGSNNVKEKQRGREGKV